MNSKIAVPKKPKRGLSSQSFVIVVQKLKNQRGPFVIHWIPLNLINNSSFLLVIHLKSCRCFVTISRSKKLVKSHCKSLSIFHIGPNRSHYTILCTFPLKSRNVHNSKAQKVLTQKTGNGMNRRTT